MQYTTYIHTQSIKHCVRIHAVDRADKPNTFHYMTCFLLIYKYNKQVIHTKAFRDGRLPLAGFGVQDLAGTVWSFLFCCLVVLGFFKNEYVE